MSSYVHAESATTLDGMRLAQALKAASHNVISNRNYLNEINVYPVPDSDAGSNLATTMISLAQRFEQDQENHAGDVAIAAAEAALDGARGNSGAIFAQFLYGFAQSLRGRDQVDMSTFAEAATSGTDAAYNAILEPREGTILSVLRAWSDEIREHAPKVRDFRELIERSMEKANEALKNTANQLEVLARHNVVDAGGQGFIYFANGLLAFLRGDNLQEIDFEQIMEDSASEQIHFESDEEPDSQFRFCTEALLNDVSIDNQQIRSAIEHLGDSTVIAGDNNLLKVHIHTDTPARFFELLDGYGHLRKTKVDDLHLQQAPRENHSIAIVVDSTCDMPEEEFATLPIFMVPLSVTFGNESYNDRLGMSTPHFYTKMAESEHFPTTSQPAVGAFKRTFDRLLEEYDHVVAITLAKNSSGTYQSATAARKMTESPDRIHIVDSRNLTGATGTLVRYFYNEIQKPYDSIKEPIARLEEAVGKTKVFACAANLKNAVRGGRINKVAGRLFDALRIRPLLTVSEAGKISKLSIAFGYKHALNKVISQAVQFASQTRVEDIIITHARAEKVAEKVAGQLAERLDLNTIPVIETGAVLGTHVGVGTVAVSVRIS